jgi:tetratricopeptide (TPR) repeat protein
VQEAVSHFDAALIQLALVPQTDQRDTRELEIRTSLGTSWMALRGWATPQIPVHLHRAWELAQAQKIDEHSLRIMWGLWVQLQCTGRIRDSMRWAAQMLSEAERIHNSDMKTAGRMAACVTHYYLGEYRESLQHAEALLEAYDDTAKSTMADLLNHDPKTLGGVQKAFCLWMLGQADSAVEMMQATVEHAKQRGHAFDICYAVHCAGALAGQIRDINEYTRLVDDLRRTGAQMRLPFFEHIMAGISHASVLLISNQPEQAAVEFESIMPRYDATGMGIAYTRYMGLSAQSHGEAGQHAVALEMLAKVLAYIEQPGWEEKYFYPEVLRIKGDIYQRGGNYVEAEKNFHLAIEAARAQHALSWELRATASLAALLQKLGRSEEAFECLQVILQQFNQGFDQPDLKQATALITQLHTASASRQAIKIS